MSDVPDIAHRGQGIPTVSSTLLSIVVGVIAALSGGGCVYLGLFKSPWLLIINTPTVWIIQGAFLGLWFLLGNSAFKLRKTQERFGNQSSVQVLNMLLPYESAGSRGRLDAGRDLVDNWKKSTFSLWTGVALVATLGPVLAFIDLALHEFKGWGPRSTFVICIVEYLTILVIAISIQRRWDLLVGEWDRDWSAAANLQSAKEQQPKAKQPIKEQSKQQPEQTEIPDPAKTSLSPTATVIDTAKDTPTGSERTKSVDDAKPFEQDYASLLRGVD